MQDDINETLAGLNKGRQEGTTTERPSNKKSQSGGLCVNRQRDSTASKAQNEEPCSAPAAISLAGTKMVKTLFGASAQPQVLPSNICRARMRHTGRKRAKSQYHAAGVLPMRCCTAPRLQAPTHAAPTQHPKTNKLRKQSRDRPCTKTKNRSGWKDFQWETQTFQQRGLARSC